MALGHARLAIIDVSESANQPMASADGRVQLAYNGEIYNFQELRCELERLGRVFRTRSDTEVIVEGYAEWGVDVVHRLRGMFALALYDGARDRLILMRDRVGKKPLYYALRDGVLIFASEIKGVLRYPGMPRTPNYGGIHDFLTFQYVPSPETGFADVYKLPPAHLLIAERGKSLAIRRYFQLRKPAHIGPERPLQELREELVARLREATRLRMISDVPIGAFLSGGVDSSAVVVMMALESSKPIKTFTIGFEEQAYDERIYARMLAERYGTDHHEYTVRPDGMSVIQDIVYHYGDPYADSSAIPTYYVSKIAREQVTVILNGDGGDESFLGYPRYAYLRTLEQARIGDAAWRPKSRWYEPSISYFSDAEKRALYADFMSPWLGPLDVGTDMDRRTQAETAQSLASNRADALLEAARSSHVGLDALTRACADLSARMSLQSYESALASRALEVKIEAATKIHSGP